MAVTPDGGFYAAVQGYSGYSAVTSAGILKIPILPAGGTTIEGAANAFSGYSAYGAPGMLMTISGENLASSFLDLGLDDPNPLPTQLGGVQVLFDGVPAEMFQVAPDHVICVIPRNLQGKTATSVQVTGVAGISAPFVLRLSTYGPAGYLTTYFPFLPPAGSVDGNIRNADGTLNDANHPAAAGSTVTIFETGLQDVGPVSLYWNAQPPSRYQILPPSNILSGTAIRVPGFVDALFAIQFSVPAGAPSASGQVFRNEIGTVGSGLGIYVKY